MRIAIAIYIGLYYWLIRKVIIWAVFPGSCFLFKRNIELTYMNNIGQHWIEQLRDFRGFLDVYRTVSAGLDVGSERARMLGLLCATTR